VITVDPRTGSDRLFARLRQKKGLPVVSGTLEFGDACWLGQGPEGRPVTVGVEYKCVPDVLSCIANGRFAGHQLPGLLATYDLPILLVEGDTRASLKDGSLQIRHPVKKFWFEPKSGGRGWMYRDLVHWLATVQFKAGVRVARTGDLEESAEWVAASYSWWNSKTWEDHKSHLHLHSSLDDQVSILKPTLLRQLAACLPGVGLLKSAAVARHFRSPFEMLMADEGEWEKIEGIGKGTARKICQAMMNGK